MQRALFIATAILLLDQLSKWVIMTAVLPPPGGITVTGFFNLVLTFNTGVSFGLFQGNSAWQPFVLVAVNLVVSLGLLIWLHRQPGGLMPLAVGLVVGGALGNAVDRLHMPGVIDFLDFHVAGWHWPAFNLADSTIVCGVILILADGLFQPHSKGKKKVGAGR